MNEAKKANFCKLHKAVTYKLLWIIYNISFCYRTITAICILRTFISAFKYV